MHIGPAVADRQIFHRQIAAADGGKIRHLAVDDEHRRAEIQRQVIDVFQIKRYGVFVRRFIRRKLLIADGIGDHQPVLFAKVTAQMVRSRRKADGFCAGDIGERCAKTCSLARDIFSRQNAEIGCFDLLHIVSSVSRAYSGYSGKV